MKGKDVFLSYASEDLDRIRPLVLGLKGAGWSVFWDRTIPAGKTWRGVLQQELEACRSMVVVWSQASVGKDWVLEEADRGKSRGILVPVRIDDVKPPLGFSTIQAADLVGWNGSASVESFERFVTDLSTLLGERASAADDQTASQARLVSAVVEWKRMSVPNPDPRRWVVYVDNGSDAPITVVDVTVESASRELTIEDWGPVRPGEASDYELDESEFDPSGDRPQVTLRFTDSFGQRWSLDKGSLLRLPPRRSPPRRPR